MKIIDRIDIGIKKTKKIVEAILIAKGAANKK